MKIRLVCGLFAAMAISAFAQDKTAAAPGLKLDNEMKQVSYLIGRQIGESMKKDDLQIDVDVLGTAMKEVMAGKDSQIDPQKARMIMMAFQAKMMARDKAKRAKSAADGIAFLKANKAKDGVVTTASGLEYRIIKTGKGDKPKASDTVKVNYIGTLINGKEFDNSYKRGEPAEFQVGGVIKGWSEALQLMPVGSKWELVIPSELAYGKQGAGHMIPPDSVLKFEVELLEIKK